MKYLKIIIRRKKTGHERWTKHDDKAQVLTVLLELGPTYSTQVSVLNSQHRLARKITDLMIWKADLNSEALTNQITQTSNK
jgi:hypothetical protein